MFQQITPVFSLPQWGSIFSGARIPLKVCLSFVVATSWILGLNAKPVSQHFTALETELTMVADTIIDASICAGETYIFNGELLNASGVYTASYPLPDGSDSVVTLQLTVLPLSFTNLHATICEGGSYPFNGADLTQTGEYTNKLTAENGCDSIVTLDLQVLQPVTTNLSVDICAGTSYVFHGDTLTESGVYSIVLTSSEGCDSIVTLHLNLVDFFDVPVKATICAGDAYTFGGTDYSNSGVYTYSLPTAGGCDSVLTLTLTVLPAISSHQSLALCIGTYYDFHGDSLTENGIYETVLNAANGCDSTVVLDLAFVTSFETNIEATICTGGLYIFDTDFLDAPGTYIHQYLAQGGCDSTVTLTLTVLPVSFGSDQATICAGDSYEYDGVVLNDQGEYTFVFEAANGCDSTVTFTLNVLPPIGSSYEVTICQGETYAFGTDILGDPGTYEAILTAENGCDSIVTLTLNVLPVQETTLSVSICEGESYDYNGESWADNGSYVFVFTGENGCDSTVTLVLTVNPAQHTTLTLDICDGDSYEFDGAPLSEAGTYTAVFTGENGCDSTVTLLLGILPLQNTAFEATICANDTYDFNGETLNTAGTYTAVLTGVNGCDSTVVLSLNVLPTQSTAVSGTICEGTSYDYYGMLLSAAGDFVFTFQSENGCDSTVTVTITVLPVAKTSIAATICAGDAFDYNGELLSDAGDYSFVYNGENGCDSTVTVSVTVLPTLSSLTAASLCVGSEYVFNGDTLSSSGIYDYTFTGSNGCDSTATLVLEFVTSFETNLQASICMGESYVFGNDTLTESGDYNQLLLAQGGCDSLVNLALTVLPVSESASEATICAGETYEFNGLSLDMSGTYSYVLTSANGCDSTAILQLTVLPVQHASIDETICANESYNFNGELLSDAGTYATVFTGTNGCDSMVVLTLSVLPIQSSGYSQVICANESVDFYGQTLTQSGTYTNALQGVNGCDSIITLQLEVLPLAESAFAASVCNGESFEYNGEVFTQSGEYYFLYPGAGANGCDSVETLFLTIFPAIPPTDVSASICEGSTYDFHGTSLDAAGTYTATLSSSVGCDSIIVLTLSVTPNVVTSISAAICAGESYPFHGENLSVAGTYTAQLSSAADCDSTVILSLSVNTVNTGIAVQGGTITTQATNATFQWINCATNQNIAGATDNFYTPTVTGNYAVVVTQNGCTATSTCVFVQVVATTEPLSEQAWTLMPNPATTQAQIQFIDGSTENLLLEMHDLAGRLLFSQKVAAGTHQINLDLTNMPDGILVVRLTTEKEVSAKRLMKAEH